jgi:hypothetical protein
VDWRGQFVRQGTIRTHRTDSRRAAAHLIGDRGCGNKSPGHRARWEGVILWVQLARGANQFTFSATFSER